MTKPRQPRKRPASQDIAAPTSELDVAEIAKLKQENAGLRLQRWIAVATVLVTLLGIVLSNLPTLRSLFVSPPRTRLRVTADDAFLRRSSQVKVNDTGGKLVAAYPMQEDRFIDVAPGQSHVEVVIGDEVVLEKDLLLAQGETKSISVSSDVLRKIRVAVSGLEPRLHATQPMIFDIKASGSGFVWVFREDSTGHCELVFPVHDDGTALRSEENTIHPDHAFGLPTPNTTVAAPARPGSSKVYVLVTSTEDAARARSIVANYCKLDAAKALSSLDLKENWGMQIISFEVF